MLLSFLGWLWVVAGVLFLVKPEFLRSRLKKKSYKRLRGWLFGMALFFGFVFIGAAWQAQGIFAKVVLILGVVAIVKAFFFLKAKAAE